MGYPESVAIGLTLLGGNPVSIAFVIAVFLSNVPEGMAASVELARTGYSKARILAIWGGVVVLCVVAAAVGLHCSPPNVAPSIVCRKFNDFQRDGRCRHRHGHWFLQRTFGPNRIFICSHF